MRFVKGGVARAGCRRRGRAGGNRSGAADLAAVLVTYHRRGVAEPLASSRRKDRAQGRSARRRDREAALHGRGISAVRWN